MAARGIRKQPAAGRKAAATRRPAASEHERRVTELRALAHPIRLQLYELFAEAPHTTMQAAEMLGVPPTRLYHHVNALERAGLLRLKETRPNRGTIEKYFEAVVQEVRSSGPEPFGRGAAAKRSARAVASTLFEQARQDLVASMTGGAHPPGLGPIGLRLLLAAPPARIAKVRKRLLALITEIREDNTEPAGESEEGPQKPGDEVERWALTLAFAPSWPRRRSGA